MLKIIGGKKVMNKEKEKRTTVINEKKWYREKIADAVNKIEDAWILNQILTFIRNMTK
ncbi:MAG: hypothetical protein NC312_03265 [Bacteroides fragilis]|nr:hypothetical protein [Bacteroides fragilis]